MIPGLPGRPVLPNGHSSHENVIDAGWLLSVAQMRNRNTLLRRSSAGAKTSNNAKAGRMSWQTPDCGSRGGADTRSFRGQIVTSRPSEASYMPIQTAR